MQCIKRYFQSKLIVNIYNAGKYLSKIIPTIIVIYYQSIDASSNVKKFQTKGFYYYAISNIIATIWCTIWDFYMDWGLFRAKKKENFILRDHMKF